MNFFAKLFNLPLKNDEAPRELISEQQLFLALGAIFTFLFFNLDEVPGLKLKNGTKEAYDQISELVKLNVEKVKVLGPIDKAIDDAENPQGFLHLYGDNLIRRMLKDYSVEDVIVEIMLSSTGVLNLSPQVYFFCIGLILVCPNFRSLFVE